MREIIMKLAMSLPPAAVLFIPLYFLLRKKLPQSILAGVFFIVWLILAIILPNH